MQAKEVIDRFGGVDILVNNAAVVAGGRIVDMDPAELQRTMDINLMAHFWVNLNFCLSLLILRQFFRAPTGRTFSPII